VTRFQRGSSIPITTACASTYRKLFSRRQVHGKNLKKALRGDYEETVWDHLAGTVSAPFEAGDHGQVAVKVIDERGNELLIVKP